MFLWSGWIFQRFPMKCRGAPKVLLGFTCKSNPKTTNNRTAGGANNEYRGGPGGRCSGFCSPGGGLLALVAVVACHYGYEPQNPTRDYRNQYRDHQDHPCTRYQPPRTII